MAAKSKEIMEGSKAPAFDLSTDAGGRVKLADLRGKKVVLYFYPKDETSGCTREAVEFTALEKSFKRAGAVIVGISKDSVAKHDKFKEKHELTIALASDEAGETIAAYGAWVEKSLYGRKYMGIDRSTFVIDPKGVVRKIWRMVKVPGHVEEVLAAVKSID
jgi:peroxiredoxin Q/BCP